MKYSKKDKKEIEKLSEYFNLAKEEKSTFSSDKAKALIAAHIAGGASIGFLAKFTNFFTENAISASIGLSTVIAGLSLFFYTQNANKPLNLSSAEQANKISAQTAQTQFNSSVIANELNCKEGASAGISNKKAIQVNSKTYSSKRRSAKFENLTLASNNESLNAKLIKEYSDKNIALQSNNENVNGKIVNEQDLVLIEQSKENFASNLSDISSKRSIAMNNAPLLNIERASEPKPAPKQIRYLADLIEKSNFWGSYNFAGTRIDKSIGIQLGGKIGWTFNDALTFGAFGYGILSSAKAKYIDSLDNVCEGSFSSGSGGIFVEYTFIPEEVIHYGVGAGLGIGAKSVSNYKTSRPWELILNIAPSAFLEANVNSWLKAGIDASYKINYSLYKTPIYKKNPSLNNSTPSDISIGLFVKVQLI